MHIYYTNGSHLGCQTREKMETKKTEDIIVSIITLTYNHEPYIRECLDGILMQQTSFKFELLIHDDASTDNTANIIREYESKYPEIIKPIYQIENQYSKKVPIGATYLYPRAKGKYIALCEGDDYWTDPLKLQKQVDYLESHPDYVMCSHRFKQFFQDEQRFFPDWYSDVTTDVIYDLESLINGLWYHHPLSVVFRRSALYLDEYSRYPINTDAVLFFHLLKSGKGILFNQECAVYRIHQDGIWTMIGMNNQRKHEFLVRLGIYEVEQSQEAALNLKTQFKKTISRKWMLKEWHIIFKVFRIISIHFGFYSALRLFLKKLLLNKY